MKTIVKQIARTAVLVLLTVGFTPFLTYAQEGSFESRRLYGARCCGVSPQQEHPLQHLGESRLFLVGHSCGGMLEMSYAARCRDRVERLILIASVAPQSSLSTGSKTTFALASGPKTSRRRSPGPRRPNAGSAPTRPHHHEPSRRYGEMRNSQL